MARILIAIILSLSASLAQAGGGFGEQHAGVWRGVGLQDGSDSWLIILDVSAGKAKVDYPDFPCGGTWEYGLELGRSLSAFERLEYGQYHCIDNSRIVVESPSDTQLFVSWFDEAGAEMSFAVLHRDDPALNDLAAEHAETSLTRMTRNLGLPGGPGCLPPTS